MWRSPFRRTFSSHTAVLCAVLLACATTMPMVALAQDGTCSSTTEAFIHRVVTVAQKPLQPVLIQRYRGSAFDMSCFSMKVTAGPSACPSTAPIVPSLCKRLVADTFAPLVCETLNEFSSDANAKVSRGSRTGPEYWWVIKVDFSTLQPNCFPRAYEIRLLAFVAGAPSASVAAFVILLIVTIIVLAMIVAMIAYAAVRQSRSLDAGGVASIAGPKMNYLGSQMHAVEHGTMAGLAGGITKVVLPVRAGAGTEDLSTRYTGDALRSPGQTIMANGAADGADPRAPSSIRRRRLRASPPAPGDGVNDGQLQNQIEFARRHAARRRAPARMGAMPEEDMFEGEGMDDPGMLLDLNDPRGGDIVFDDAGEPIGRRRPRALRGAPAGVLFPTQDNWNTMDGDEPLAFDEDGNPIYRPEEDDDGEAFASGGAGQTSGRRRAARMPGGLAGPSGPRVRFVPQWMYGSFGRGGAIPDVGDSTGLNNDASTATGGHVDPERRLMITGYDSAASPVASRFHPPNRAMHTPQQSGRPPIGPQSGLQAGTTPRSALKRRVGGALPTNPQPEAEEDAFNATRRSSNGPAGTGTLQRKASNLRGSSVGSDGPAVATLGDGGPVRTDSFVRASAKVHGKHLSLNADAYQPEALDETTGASSRQARGGGHDNIEGRGSDSYVLPQGSGSGQWVCADCNLRINPNHPADVYCESTGKRHF